MSPLISFKIVLAVCKLLIVHVDFRVGLPISEEDTVGILMRVVCICLPLHVLPPSSQFSTFQSMLLGHLSTYFFNFFQLGFIFFRMIFFEVEFISKHFIL